MFKRFINKYRTPVAETKQKSELIGDLAVTVAQEFKDRNRKNIQTWRNGTKAAENPEDPRWYILQDLIDDLMLDAHLASVIDVRKSATLNHRFYVRDKKTQETLDEQTKFLNKQWFYEFLDKALDSIARKYTIAQGYRNGDYPAFSYLPRRNVCIQFGRLYIEVSGDKFIDYRAQPNVIEIIHSSDFGLINDVAPNVIWKRNALQSYAEFTEKYGQPLITATTNNKAEIPRINQSLKTLGESATGVLPHGTTITVHDLANAGNPEKTYIENAKFQDNQVSKRWVGSTTMVDEGANRSQTEVHEKTLDDKISLSDKRSIMFCVNDQLFPVLQNLGFDFNIEKHEFVFDETESMTLSDQWKITEAAMREGYEMDEDELRKTFNLPITGKKERYNPFNGFGSNFQ